MALNTIELISDHIASTFNLPIGVSGNMVNTVDLSRIDVQNYVGQSIDKDAISESYQSIITNFSKAQALQESFAWASTVATSGGAVIISSGTSDLDTLKLGELSIEAASEAQTNSLNFLSTLSKETPSQFRQLAMDNLKNIGRKARFARSLS